MLAPTRARSAAAAASALRAASARSSGVSLSHASRSLHSSTRNASSRIHEHTASALLKGKQPATGTTSLHPNARTGTLSLASSSHRAALSRALQQPQHQRRTYATPTEDRDHPDKKPKKQDEGDDAKTEFEKSIERGLREAKEGKKDAGGVPDELKSFFDHQKSRSDAAKEESSGESKSASSSKSKKEEGKKSSGEKKDAPNGSPFGGPGEVRLNGNTIIATIVATYLIYRLTSPETPSREITWQEFRTAFLDKGLVDRLVVVNRSRVKVYLHSNVTGAMSSSSSNNGFGASGSGPSAGASPAGQSSYWFSVGSVEAFERRLDEAQRELGIPSGERIPVAYHEEISTANTLLHFAPTLLLAGLLFYMTRRAAGGAMGGGGGGGPGGIFGIGKSRAKMFNQETDVKTKFENVAGMDEAKEEIMEFVNFLKKPERYERLGAKIPRGAILSGPPGTGKTLLAKATAGEAGVPFLSVSGSEFVEMVSKPFQGSFWCAAADFLLRTRSSSAWDLRACVTCSRTPRSTRRASSLSTRLTRSASRVARAATLAATTSGRAR